MVTQTLLVKTNIAAWNISIAQSLVLQKYIGEKGVFFWHPFNTHLEQEGN